MAGLPSLVMKPVPLNMPWPVVLGASVVGCHFQCTMSVAGDVGKGEGPSRCCRCSAGDTGLSSRRRSSDPRAWRRRARDGADGRSASQPADSPAWPGSHSRLVVGAGRSRAANREHRQSDQQTCRHSLHSHSFTCLIHSITVLRARSSLHHLCRRWRKDPHLGREDGRLLPRVDQRRPPCSPATDR